MIRLEIENTEGKFDLVLKRNTSIRMEHNSPLFQTEVIPGSRTYSFGIPVNDINREHLKRPELLMFNGKVKIYNCNYYFWNKLVSSGKLVVLRSNKEYRAQFTVNPFAIDFKDLKITEIIDEEFNVILPVYYANYVITTDYSEFPFFQFPEIRNPNFYEGAEIENNEFELTLNQYDPDEETFIENEYIVVGEINDNKNTLVPQPYFYHVFSELLKTLGYKIKGDFTRDDRIKKLLIYNNYPLDEFNIILQGLNTFKTKFNLNQLLPDLSVSEFINTIKDFLSLGVFFDTANKEVLFVYKNTIINSNTYFDLDPYAPDEFESELSQDGGYEISYNFDNDDRAKLISVDLSNEETIEVDIFSDLIPFHGQNRQIFYVRSTGEYFRSEESESVFPWTRLSDHFYPIKSGEGKFKIDLKLSTLLNFIGNRPIILQTGSSDAFVNGRNQPGFKLFIWHGLQPDSNDKYHPFASSLNLNPKGEKVADFTMQLDGEEGVFNTFHKEWLEFASDADKIRVIAHLPIEAYFRILDVFSADENAARKIRYRGINFVPEQISALHKMDGDLVETEIIMHKKASVKVEFAEQPSIPPPPLPDFLVISPSSVNINSLENLNLYTGIKSLSAWLANSNSTWITLIIGSGVGHGTMTYNADENTDLIARIGTVTVTNSVSTAVFTVYQEAGLSAPIIVPSSFDVSAPGLLGFFASIISASAWTAVSNDLWIVLVGGSGSGDGPMNYSVAQNDTQNSRIGTVTVTNNTGSSTFTVNQAAGNIIVQDLLVLTPSSISLDSFGSANETVNIKSHSAWNASSDDNWITMINTSGTGNGTISFSVNSYIRIGSRVGSITVINGIALRTITINQQGPAPPPTTVLSASPMRIDAVWGTNPPYIINITCNTNWVAAPDESWITIIPGDESGFGNANMEIAVDLNPNRFARIGRINIVAGTLNVTVRIEQAAGTGEV